MREECAYNLAGPKLKLTKWQIFKLKANRIPCTSNNNGMGYALGRTRNSNTHLRCVIPIQCDVWCLGRKGQIQPCPTKTTCGRRRDQRMADAESYRDTLNITKTKNNNKRQNEPDHKALNSFYYLLSRWSCSLGRMWCNKNGCMEKCNVHIALRRTDSACRM